MPDDPRDDAEGAAEEYSPRPFWSGTITFGLVAIPVDLFSATRSGTVRLRLLDADGTPVARRYVCPADGRTLSSDEIARGYEVEPGRFVTVTDEELESLAPEASREIDLRLFVPADEVPVVQLERAYYLAPSGQTSKAYRLLAETMERSRRAGIATFVMRERAYVVAIVAESGILRAETLRYADELRSPDEVGAPERAASQDARRRLERAVAKLAAERLKEAELEDPYARALRTLVERKLTQRKDLLRNEAAAEEAGERPVDLVAVIRERMRLASEPAAPAPGAGDDDEELEDLSREDLIERARELGLAGRSRMSKAALIDALRAR